MTNEVKKAYLLTIDDVGMAFLNRVIPGIQYVEVQGMDLKDNPAFRALVTPIPQEPPKETTPDAAGE
jgi:hypothetical protein